MRSSWSLKEDCIVCEFYLNRVDTWQSSVDILMSILKDAGFGARERTAVIMRVQNYAYLHTGHGLSNASKQSRIVYKLATEGKL